jgi:hypothetical protein
MSTIVYYQNNFLFAMQLLFVNFDEINYAILFTQVSSIKMKLNHHSPTYHMMIEVCATQVS